MSEGRFPYIVLIYYLIGTLEAPSAHSWPVRPTVDPELRPNSLEPGPWVLGPLDVGQPEEKATKIPIRKAIFSINTSE